MPTKKLQLQATISIKDIIAKAIPSLTPAHRHMADYVLAHSFRAATMTIDELAVATNVSVATANRFARCWDSVDILLSARSLCAVMKVRCHPWKNCVMNSLTNLLAQK